MKKLYEKSEVAFALVWIGIYVVMMNIALQVCYAVVIGFLYTVIVYKGGSLWPCIASHMFVNGSSVFGLEQGPFTNLVQTVFGQSSAALVQACSAVLIMVISGGYALWLWKKA